MVISSFKGKRSSKEDFCEASISEVDDQIFAFFGVFDGKSLDSYLRPFECTHDSSR